MCFLEDSDTVLNIPLGISSTLANYVYIYCNEVRKRKQVYLHSKGKVMPNTKTMTPPNMDMRK